METTFVRRNKRVVFRRLGDEIIVKLRGRAALSRLNLQGACIWDLVGSGRSWSEVVSEVLCDVPESYQERVIADLDRFLLSMVRDGLFVLDQAESVPMDPTVAGVPASDCAPSGGVAARLAELRQPVAAKFDLTSACNQQCYFCYSQMPAAKQLTTSQWIDVIDQTADLGVLSLAFTGGEIFTRPDINQIIAHAAKYGFDISLLTNGTLITLETAEFLAHQSVSGVQVSILGATDEAHDRLAGAPGMLQKTLEGARHLLSQDIPVTAKVVVSSLNADQLDDILALCQKNGIVPSVSPYVGARSNGANDTFQYRLTDEQLMRLPDVLLVAPEGPTCNAASTVFAVGPTGDVYPCERARIPMGNVTETPLKEIWLGELFERARTQHWFATPAKCQGCVFADKCINCPGEAWLTLGSLGVPDPEACRLAHLL